MREPRDFHGHGRDTGSSHHAEPAHAGDTPEEIAADVQAVNNIDAVPTLLQILCRSTGMGFAAVARVTNNTWTACAVKDDIGFGLLPGGQLDVDSTLCIESRASGLPIVIDHASADPRYCDHHTPKRYKIESYVSVPIVTASGRYFGNLCAVDPLPHQVSDPKTLAIFEGFAQLIAMQLESDANRQKERNQLRDERAANELREQFIAILGHDLRNPLQAVYAGGEVLQRKLTDPGLQDLAGRIKASAMRMSSLIDDVLDFARGRLGDGITLQMRESSDLGSGLSAVVKELQAVQPDRQILANISVTRTVRCDPGRIQQVASNLIGNALKHGAPSGQVKVSASMSDKDLVLEVWNEGEPIPPDSIGKIFEPFWRQTTSRDRQGLGLGLHICAQIVHAHRGTITVKSTEQDGTLFTARLPLIG